MSRSGGGAPTTEGASVRSRATELVPGARLVVGGGLILAASITVELAPVLARRRLMRASRAGTGGGTVPAALTTTLPGPGEEGPLL